MRPGQYYLAGSFTDTISVALTEDVTYAVPVELDDGTIDRIGIQVTVAGAGSLVQLGLYSDYNSDTGEFGLPGDLIEDAGLLDTSTTGTKQAIVDWEIPSDSWGVPSNGRFWLAARCTQGTPPEILAGLAPPWSELPQGTSAPSDATWAHCLTDNTAGAGFENPFGTPDIETDFGPQIFFRYSDGSDPGELTEPRVLLTGGSEETTDTFTTGPVAPGPATLVLVSLCFTGGYAGAGDINVSGAGITTFGAPDYNGELPVVIDGTPTTFGVATIFGTAGAPTEESLTIEFPVEAGFCIWHICEFPAPSPVDADNLANRGIWSSPDDGSANLSWDGVTDAGADPFDDPANFAYSVYALPADREVSATGSWTGLGSYRLEGKGTVHAQWQPTEDGDGESNAIADSPAFYASLMYEIVRA